VVVDGTRETVSGSVVGEGRGTLDLRHSKLFFAGVPRSVYTSRSAILYLAPLITVFTSCIALLDECK